ncbi:MAG: signal peptidase II [Ilumatobacteraceae bacterium]
MSILSICVDIITKVAASNALRDQNEVFGPITFRLVHNHGSIFGFGSLLPPGLIVVGTVAIASIVARSGWKGHLRPAAGVGLIVGGALANIIDRFTANSVVDFIDIGRWPVFNLADVSILAGIGTLISGEHLRAQSDL